MTGENNKSNQKLMDSELESVNGGNLIGVVLEATGHALTNSLMV